MTDHHDTSNTDVRADAKAWLTVRIGDQPIVPQDVAEGGRSREIIAAARERLARLRRHRGRGGA
jgi:hypothetical protein